MNRKNLKNIVCAAFVAACMSFTSGCSNGAQQAKPEELPEVVAAFPIKKDVVLVDDYTARLAAAESVNRHHLAKE